MPKVRPSLKGRFLLDGGKLHGSSFHRTVVLVCEHDAAGAFGLAASISVPGDADLDSAQKGFWWALNRMLDGGNVNSDTGLLRRALT